MRNAFLLLLLGVAAATWVFAFVGGGATSVEELPELLPSTRIAQEKPAENEEREKEPRVKKDLPAPTTARPQATPQEARTVEGVVLDRFGHPVVNERVYLLRSGQDFPASGVDLGFFVTSLTSREGEFTLRAPDEGPWRVAVGDRGRPRVDSSEPRTLDGADRAEIVVPGAAGVRVLLDGVPRDGSYVQVELSALNQPVSPANRVENESRPAPRGGARAVPTKGAAKAPPGSRKGRRGDAGAGKAEAAESTGSEEGSDSGVFRSLDDPREHPVRRLVDPEETSALATLLPQDADGGGGQAEGAKGQQGKAGQQGKGQRKEAGDAKTGGRRAARNRQGRAVRDLQKEHPDIRIDPRTGGKIDPDAGRRLDAESGGLEREDQRPIVPITPQEQWVSMHRHLVSAEELEAGVAEFSGLEAGRIVRLAVRVGAQRIEGEHRFTLMKDAVTEVRILTIKTGQAARLVYSSSLEMLPEGERPEGIRWVD